jgi:hypothetical protein
VGVAIKTERQKKGDSIVTKTLVRLPSGRRVWRNTDSLKEFPQIKLPMGFLNQSETKILNAVNLNGLGANFDMENAIQKCLILMPSTPELEVRWALEKIKDGLNHLRSGI